MTLPAPRRSFGHFSGHGAANGAFAGFIAAELYLFGLAAFDFVLGHDPGGAGLAVVLGQLYGVLPSIALGALAGAAAGAVFYFLQRRLTTRNAPWYGLGVAAVLGSPLIALGTLATLSAPSLGGLVVWLPVVGLYLAAGAWAGARLAGGRLALSPRVRALLVTLAVGVGLLVFARAVLGRLFADHSLVALHTARRLDEGASQEWLDQECQRLGFRDALALEIVAEPGYELRLCTGGAGQYLREHPELTTFPVEFVVHYKAFRYDGLEVRRVGEWTGRGVPDRRGTACLHAGPSTECGGPRVNAVTERLFGYFRQPGP